MPDGGWIPLWRKIWDSKISPRRKKRPYTEFEAWLDLLCRAVQKSEGITLKRDGEMPLKLKSGEILCSLRGLQETWKWGSPNKVQRYIASLCILEMVEISGHKPTRLRIVNAELYGLVRNKKRNSDGTATEQRRNSDGTIQQEEQVFNKEKQGKTKKKEVSPAAPASHISFLKSWNESGFKKALKLTASRTKQLRARMNDNDWRNKWEEALRQLVKIPFANGQNDRGWIANIDFFLRPDTVTKILEGEYISAKPMTVTEQEIERLRKKREGK